MPPRAKTTTTTPATRRNPRQITADYVAALLSYADILYKGGLVPKNKNSPARPETVAALIEVGRDVGLPATQAISWIMLVNGRPSIWGDAGLALILASGLLEERAEWYEGEPGTDEHTACFKVKRVGAKQERVSRFSVADAKRAELWGKEGPWTTYPERQMMWRAKGFACRDEFPDVLCGLIFAEESLDFPDAGRVQVVQPSAAELPPVPPVVVAPPPPPPAAGPTDEQFDRMAELKLLVCASRGCATEDERRAAWLETLEPWGVSTARDFTAEAAAKFIESVGKAQDPFTHPPAATPAAT